MIWFIMVIFADLVFLPICWMESRSQSPIKSLWNLMATLVVIVDQVNYGRLVDEHSIWLLRKELSHPERMRSQFTISVLGIEFTYTELLKLHFWLGLLVLLFAYEVALSPSAFAASPWSRWSQTRESAFGNLLSDPLGIISGFEVRMSETITD